MASMNGKQGEKAEAKRLTREEREFAGEQHREIAVFLRSKGLDKEEYYDIVVFGYLKAVMDYCRKPSARAYPFRTVARRAMLDSLYKHWRHEGRQKRKPMGKVFSLDREMESDEGVVTLHDMVASRGASVAEQFESEDALRRMTEELSSLGKTIIAMLRDGFAAKEIKSVCSIGEREYSRELGQIKAEAAIAYGQDIGRWRFL